MMAAESMERLGALDPETLSIAQREVVATLVAGPRGGLNGPFVPLIRSPELCDRVQSLGEYLRYRCAVPERLRELAICQTARLWRQNYEWHVHSALAIRAGVHTQTIAALIEDGGERADSGIPVSATEDEKLVLMFCREIHLQRTVGDRTWARALVQLGEAGVVDLLGLCGYYALLAMVMNAARTALPSGVEPAFPPAWE